jgi:putative transposase
MLVEHVAQSGWETQNARGTDRKTHPAGQVATKREVGTGRNSGETGTAVPRGAAAWTMEHPLGRSRSR